ncbi:MAG TPA: DUF4926 domain-containing protein [Candidatus Kapabacteria bacterium]|nr:DUF4926 domain-containing protein [Candidatus Kapabacteria bacterium]
MKFELFSEVALSVDISAHGLKKGDVATVVERIEPKPNGEPGYALEVSNAVGESVDVLLVTESQIEALRPDELWHIRSLAGTSA